MPIDQPMPSRSGFAPLATLTIPKLDKPNLPSPDPTMEQLRQFPALLRQALAGLLQAFQSRQSAAGDQPRFTPSQGNAKPAETNPADQQFPTLPSRQSIVQPWQPPDWPFNQSTTQAQSHRPMPQPVRLLPSLPPPVAATSRLARDLNASHRDTPIPEVGPRLARDVLFGLNLPGTRQDSPAAFPALPSPADGLPQSAHESRQKAGPSAMNPLSWLGIKLSSPRTLSDPRSNYSRIADQWLTRGEMFGKPGQMAFDGLLRPTRLPEVVGQRPMQPGQTVIPPTPGNFQPGMTQGGVGGKVGDTDRAIKDLIAAIKELTQEMKKPRPREGSNVTGDQQLNRLEPVNRQRML